jgi:hypothetical protein
MEHQCGRRLWILIKNEIGNRYGRLIVIKDSGKRSKNNYVLWECRCDCGKVTVVRSGKLREGVTTSCGCTRNENSKKQVRIMIQKNIRHGHSNGNRREYIIYHNMMDRCYNENNRAYKDYGGRGIYVVNGWHDYISFYNDIGPIPIGFTLERINNDGPYPPDNVRLATQYEQNRNMRSNKWVEINGINMIVTDAILLLPIGRTQFYRYMKRHNLTHQETIDYYVRRTG